ncbi:hypothetical protein IAT38_001742 [Cryptococcus sp. DSM 104549]
MVLDEVSALKLQNEMQAAMSEWSVRGCAVVIVKGDEHQVMSFGKRNASDDVTPSTLFPLASCSKLITALALLRALRTHSPPLPLTTPVISILPSFRLNSPLAQAQCTVEDILCHRSGLPGYDVLFAPEYSLRELPERLGGLRLSARVGEWHQYNSILYDLLALVVERLTGKGFAEYVKKEFFKPLKMRSATFEHNPTSDHSKAFWQRVTMEGEEELRTLEYGIERMEGGGLGTGRVWMNAVDMAKWIKALPHLPEYEEATKPRNIAGAGGGLEFPDHTVLYGLAQRISTHRGVLINEHNGEIPGFLSKVSRLPEYNAGFAILTNSDPGGKFLRALFKTRMVEFLAGLPHLPWMDRLCDIRQDAFDTTRLGLFAPAPAQTLPLDPDAASDILGMWESPGFACWFITAFHLLETLPELSSLPYIPALYGEVQYLFAPGDKEGEYRGCTEWTSHDTGEVMCGFPFRVEVKGGEMRVFEMTGVGEGLEEDDWPVVFERVE